MIQEDGSGKIYCSGSLILRNLVVQDFRRTSENSGKRPEEWMVSRVQNGVRMCHKVHLPSALELC